MRIRLYTRQRAKDVRAGKHYSDGWWKDLCADIEHRYGFAVERTAFSLELNKNKIWINSVGDIPVRELFFKNGDNLCFSKLDLDNRKASIVYGPGHWSKTWVDVFKALDGEPFCDYEYICGSRRRVVSKRRN